MKIKLPQQYPDNEEQGKLCIALITNNYTPYSGGVVSSIDAQVAALQEDGHRVWVITLDFLGKKHQDSDFVIRIQTPIKFRCRQNHYAIPWFMVTQLRRIMSTINADIVHLHHPFLLATKGLEVAREMNLPVVFTYHTLYEEYAHYVPMPTAAAKSLIRKLVHRFSNTVDTIVVPSPCIKAYLHERNIDTQMQCIPSPLQSCFQDIPFIERQHSTIEPIKLLSVVRFTREKNVALLLDVCRLLNERFEMTLVGYGIEYENLRSYAYEVLQLSPQQLQFVVKPPREQLIRYYQQADLFLFSSTTDTQGLVLLEAMACSTPVIAVHGPGQSDLVQQYKNGLLVTTASEMAQAINYVAEDRKVFLSMQKGAWQTAQNYLPERFREQLLILYRQLMSAQSRRASMKN